ncbi:unnamed protein product, partial [Brachionus calyciflorus]
IFIKDDFKYELKNDQNIKRDILVFYNEENVINPFSLILSDKNINRIWYYCDKISENNIQNWIKINNFNETVIEQITGKEFETKYRNLDFEYCNIYSVLKLIKIFLFLKFDSNFGDYKFNEEEYKKFDYFIKEKISQFKNFFIKNNETPDVVILLENFQINNTNKFEIEIEELKSQTNDSHKFLNDLEIFRSDLNISKEKFMNSFKLNSIGFFSLYLSKIHLFHELNITENESLIKYIKDRIESDSTYLQFKGHITILISFISDMKNLLGNYLKYITTNIEKFDIKQMDEVMRSNEELIERLREFISTFFDFFKFDNNTINFTCTKGKGYFSELQSKFNQLSRDLNIPTTICMNFEKLFLDLGDKMNFVKTVSLIENISNATSKEEKHQSNQFDYFRDLKDDFNNLLNEAFKLDPLPNNLIIKVRSFLHEFNS